MGFKFKILNIRIKMLYNLINIIILVLEFIILF
jgi:hypothetical protein